MLETNYILPKKKKRCKDIREAKRDRVIVIVLRKRAQKEKSIFVWRGSNII
jgi:hypothetical protein